MLVVETEREPDGRWLADVVALPGCLAYGRTQAEARRAAEALALRVCADRLEHDEEAHRIDPGRHLATLAALCAAARYQPG